MDDELVQCVGRAKLGDRAAFEKLYAAVYKKLYRTAYYIMRSPEDAEDAVMDTVAAMYSGIGALRDDSNFESWAFRILCNKARRGAGKAYDRRTLPLEEECAGSSETGIEQAIDRSDLVKALEILSPEERAIIALCVCERYPGAVAADMLGLNPNTLR